MNDLRSSLEPVRDGAELARRGGEIVAGCARDAIAARGRFNIALTGGSSPLEMYSLLGTPEFRERVDPARTDFFFGDDRAVPPGDVNSNFKPVNERWLVPAGVPAANVRRIPGERKDLETIAEEYERATRAAVPAEGGTPAFDLVLLGIGNDGHVLSMYPHCSDIESPRALVVALRDPPMNPRISRISFTPPMLRAARCVLLLANGTSKAEPLRALLEGAHDPLSTPAQLLRDVPGRVVILADEPARAKLSR